MKTVVGSVSVLTARSSQVRRPGRADQSFSVVRTPAFVNVSNACSARESASKVVALSIIAEPVVRTSFLDRRGDLGVLEDLEGLFGQGQDTERRAHGRDHGGTVRPGERLGRDA